MQRYCSAAASAAAGLVIALASAAPAGASGPITWKQTYYFKVFGSAGDTSADRASYELANKALPAATVGAAQLLGGSQAFATIAQSGFVSSTPWQSVGPNVGSVPGPVTYTGRPTVNSGRVAALAIAPGCSANACTVLVGAAGGGVWKSTNALASVPSWRVVNEGLPTTAVGSLIYDPSDASSQTVYLGTGEPNGSSDSEAGLGLFRSTDGGEHWTLVAGSYAVAHDRAIGAVAVDPRNARHIWIGTAVARHGLASTYGGRFTPPGAPQVGLYESLDGGASFTLAFSQPSDTPVANTPGGNDYFRGGVTSIKTYRRGDDAPTQIYFSMFDYGLFRSKANGGGYEQVFASAGGGSAAGSLDSRTEFALAPMGNRLRIYVGDTGTGPADFYRTDNANVPAGSLVTGGNNGGWIKLSHPTPGAPGYSSYNFCEGQCSYDMFVASPPGRPDVVWIGGSMNYDEIFTATPPSNGRAVMRSTNAGVSFTDMTNDTQGPAPLGMHPDQHAIALVGSSDIAIIGSDGGVVRTSGQFANASADCSSRGISGADLADCQLWLSAIPTQIISMSAGLNTLQFQGIAVNPKNPRNDVMGGTQDNGTWAYDASSKSWFESVGGDGGTPAINGFNPSVRMHSYFDAQFDVNFHGTDPLGWDWVSDPLFASGENQAFYEPLISDPSTANQWFTGLQHVFRTQDNGGPQAYLDQHCSEYFGDFSVTCGDWASLGGAPGADTSGDLTSASNGYGIDKAGYYISSIARGASANAPLWVGTRRGRIFISLNPGAGDPNAVSFRRIDTAGQPERFPSGIAVDPRNPFHAFVSFSGYEAYTPGSPGHVFEVTVDPKSGSVTWNDLSANLGDQPVTAIATNGSSVYIGTDFGVLVRDHGQWRAAAPGLAHTAVYHLVLDQGSQLLYAATHGRGIYRLAIDD